MEADGLHVGRYPSQFVSVLWPAPYTVTLLPNGSGHFRAKPFPRVIPQTCPQPSSFYTHLRAYDDGTDRVFRNIIQTPAYTWFSQVSGLMFCFGSTCLTLNVKWGVRFWFSKAGFLDLSGTTDPLNKVLLLLWTPLSQNYCYKWIDLVYK